VFQMKREICWKWVFVAELKNISLLVLLLMEISVPETKLCKRVMCACDEGPKKFSMANFI